MSPDRVELRIPASSAYLSLARAATAGICARLDFPLDRLDDLTLAVDEATSLLLLDSRPGSELSCVWEPDGSSVRILLTSHSTSGRTPRTTSFSWTVLSALVDEASARIADGMVTLELRAQGSGVAVS